MTPLAVSMRMIWLLFHLQLFCMRVACEDDPRMDSANPSEDQFENIDDDNNWGLGGTAVPFSEGRPWLEGVWMGSEVMMVDNPAEQRKKYADGNVPSDDILGQIESRDRYFEDPYSDPSFGTGLGSKSVLLGEPTVVCHGKCLCDGSTVDCSGQNLTSVPKGISPSTIKLDLSMNNIQEFHEDDLANMTRLQELLVVGNKLKSLPKHLFRNNPFLQNLNFQGNLFNKVPPTFQNLTYLQQLYLDSNSIRNVHKSAFRNLKSLKELCLNANQLKTVPVEALRKIRGLQALALNNNQITKIPDDAFQKNVKLIAIQLGNNQINTLEKNAFSGLSRLKFLDLNNNDITNVSSSLSKLDALEELNLENNKLSQIPDSMFSNKFRLETLKLDHNPIKSVSSHAFVNLPSLQELKLSEVHNMAMFPNLTGTMNLTKITLDRANIRYIPPDLCLYLEKLSVLDVHSNKIEEFPEMSQCKKLTILHMANNLLHSLEGQPFDGMDSLIDLTLNTNFIKSIPQDAFTGLSTLEYLNLAENEIRDIHPEAFQPLKRLKDLNLGKNRLHQLPTAGLKNLEKLKVFYNPDLREFPAKENFLNVNHFSMAYAYHCCDFIHSRQEQYYLDMIREYVIWMKDGEPEHMAMLENYVNLSKLWSNMMLEDIESTEEFVLINFSDQLNEILSRPSEIIDNFQLEGEWYSNASIEMFLEDNFDNITFENGAFFDHFGNEFEVSDLLAKPEATSSLKDYTSQPNYVVAKAAITCRPMPGPFMPCDDLFGWWSLRCGVWFVFMLALLGNGVVFFVSVTSKSKMDVPRFLICNLALADFFMGIYLGILAIVDASTLGQFKKFAIQWQMSASCLVAGVLGVLSSELSVFTLTVITLERFYAITHAMQLNKRLSLKHAACIMLGGWLWSFSLALMPLFGISDYRKFAVCLPFEIEDVISKSYVCFIMVFNGISFFIILSCYLIMYISIRDSQAWNSNDTRVAKRMALLVFTDFLCWAPIAFLSLAAAFGKNLIHLNEAKVLTIFVLPLNSCANPFLYAFFTKQFKRDCVLLCRRLEDSSIARHFSQGSQRQASYSWKNQRRLSGLHSLMGEGKFNNSPNGSSGSNSYGLINYNSEVSAGSNRKDSGGFEKIANNNNKSKSVMSVSSNGTGHKYRYKICPGDDDDVEDIEAILKRSFVKGYKCNECNNRDAHIILHQDFYSHSGTDTNNGTSETYLQEKDDLNHTQNSVSDIEDDRCRLERQDDAGDSECEKKMSPAMSASIHPQPNSYYKGDVDCPNVKEPVMTSDASAQDIQSPEEGLLEDSDPNSTGQRECPHMVDLPKIPSSDSCISQELTPDDKSASHASESNHLSDSGNGGEISTDSLSSTERLHSPTRHQQYDPKPSSCDKKPRENNQHKHHENACQVVKITDDSNHISVNKLVIACSSHGDAHCGLCHHDRKKDQAEVSDQMNANKTTGNSSHDPTVDMHVKSKSSGTQKKKHSRKHCHRHHKSSSAASSTKDKRRVSAEASKAPKDGCVTGQFKTIDMVIENCEITAEPLIISSHDVVTSNNISHTVSPEPKVSSDDVHCQLSI